MVAARDGGPALRWAGVGSSNVASNHARTAGEKTSSVTGTPYPQSRTSGEPPLGCGRCSVLRTRCAVVLAPLAILVVAVVGALPALASSSSPSPSSETSPGPAPGSAGNQVVLVGRVVVPQGQSVGEVIVFSGRVLVEGIVRGDVVVLDGPITVSGQVSGSVVALDGSVRLLGTAQVGGDVLAHDRVVVAQGAGVQGRMTEDVVVQPEPAVARRRGVRVVARGGAVDAGARPRVRVGGSARTRPHRGGRPSGAMGLGGMGCRAGARVPAAAVLGVVAVLGIPLGVGLLLSILLLSLIGVVVTAQTVGRRLLDRDRGTATAFLAGWAIETAIGVIPYVSGAVYAAAAVFGLGATTVAVWRARGPRRGAKPAGKHRAGAAGATRRTRPGAVRLPVCRARRRCRARPTGRARTFHRS